MFLLQRLRNIYNNYIGYWLGFTQRPLSRAEQLLPEEVRKKWEWEQDELKKQMILQDTVQLTEMVNMSREGVNSAKFYIAGVDISFVKGDDVNACAALVVLSYPDLKTMYSACEMVQLTAPYIPGFLGFREVPFIVQLFDQLRVEMPEIIPHVVMVDGNGLLHPREFGSACHLGVSLRLPCIGVAKKLFHVDGLEKDSEHQRKIDSLQKGGDTFPLIGNSGKTLGMDSDGEFEGFDLGDEDVENGEQPEIEPEIVNFMQNWEEGDREPTDLGFTALPGLKNGTVTALRSCNNTRNPVYVSPGHLVTMETATRLVHKCCKHRVPEPVRLADILSREYIRDNFKPDVSPTDLQEIKVEEKT